MLTLVLSLILGGSNPPTGSNVICCHYADDGNLVCKLPVDNPEKLRAWRDRSAAKARQRQRAREPGGESAKPRKRLRKVNKARAEKKRVEHFGTPERVAAIRCMDCACTRAPKQHPDCTGGFSDPSHTTSRGAGGDAADIVPMSAGCHRAWHQHGKHAWLVAVGWTEQDIEAELERTNAELAKPDPMPE